MTTKGVGGGKKKSSREELVGIYRLAAFTLGQNTMLISEYHREIERLERDSEEQLRTMKKAKYEEKQLPGESVQEERAAITPEAPDSAPEGNA